MSKWPHRGAFPLAEAGPKENIKQGNYKGGGCLPAKCQHPFQGLFPPKVEPKSLILTNIKTIQHIDISEVILEAISKVN